MNINIERLGLKDVAVDPNTLFSFPKGMAGFENCKSFKLFHEEGGGTVFLLQSTDDASVTFPIVPHDTLNVSYDIELSDEDCALIGLQDPQDAAVVVVVYRDEKGGIAANTRSPVILNLKTRKGMQKVLHDAEAGLVYRAR